MTRLGQSSPIRNELILIIFKSESSRKLHYLRNDRRWQRTFCIREKHSRRLIFWHPRTATTKILFNQNWDILKITQSSLTETSISPQRKMMEEGILCWLLCILLVSSKGNGKGLSLGVGRYSWCHKTSTTKLSANQSKVGFRNETIWLATTLKGTRRVV